MYAASWLRSVLQFSRRDAAPKASKHEKGFLGRITFLLALESGFVSPHLFFGAMRRLFAAH